MASSLPSNWLYTICSSIGVRTISHLSSRSKSSLIPRLPSHIRLLTRLLELVFAQYVV